MSLEEGKTLVETGELGAALIMLSQVYKNSGSVDALYYQALANTRLENNAAAAEMFSQVLGLDPKFDTAHAYRGMNLAAMGLLTLSILDYNIAIKLNAKDSASFFNRAEANAKLGNMQLAVADLTDYLERQPEDEDAAQLRAKCLRQLQNERVEPHRKNDNQLGCTEAFASPPPPTAALAKTQTFNSTNADPDSLGRLSNVFFSPRREQRSPSSTLSSNEIPSALKKRRSNNFPMSEKKSAKKVVFSVVKIREHARMLGGSGGVPERGGISLGLAFDHLDRADMSIDDYESQRVPVRVLKDELMPSPARTRRILLQQAMGDKRYYERHREECRDLKLLRRSREHALEQDHMHHPDYGTLEEEVHPTALSNGKSAEVSMCFADKQEDLHMPDTSP